MTSDHSERILLVTNEHWVKFVAPTVVAVFLLAISILLFLLAGMSSHHYMWLSHATYLSALLLFLLTMHWYFMILLSESLDRIIVTNKRLMRTQYRLIFHEDTLEINFDIMRSVEANKEGLIQNLLHYGTLSFENDKAFVRLVPRPNHVARAIRDAMRTY